MSVWSWNLTVWVWKCKSFFHSPSLKIVEIKMTNVQFEIHEIASVKLILVRNEQINLIKLMYFAITAQTISTNIGVIYISVEFLQSTPFFSTKKLQLKSLSPCWVIIHPTLISLSFIKKCADNLTPCLPAAVCSLSQKSSGACGHQLQSSQKTGATTGPLSWGCDSHSSSAHSQ